MIAATLLGPSNWRFHSHTLLVSFVFFPSVLAITFFLVACGVRFRGLRSRRTLHKMLLTPSIILLGVGFALADDHPPDLSAFTTGSDLSSYMSVCITVSPPPSASMPFTESTDFQIAPRDTSSLIRRYTTRTRRNQPRILVHRSIRSNLASGPAERVPALPDWPSHLRQSRGILR